MASMDINICHLHPLKPVISGLGYPSRDADANWRDALGSQTPLATYIATIAIIIYIAYMNIYIYNYDII